MGVYCYLSKQSIQLEVKNLHKFIVLIWNHILCICNFIGIAPRSDQEPARWAESTYPGRD
jgi:hypothetical protein